MCLPGRKFRQPSRGLSKTGTCEVKKLSRRDPRKKAFIENRIKDVKKSRNEQIKEDIFLMRLE